MRVLIRHIGTGMFYQAERSWTVAPAAAWDFKASANALQLVTELKLTEVEILLWFDDPRYNLSLPLQGQHPPNRP
jgi:hypothetical protein